MQSNAALPEGFVCLQSTLCEGRYRGYVLSYVSSLLLGSWFYDRATQLDRTLLVVRAARRTTHRLSHYPPPPPVTPPAARRTIRRPSYHPSPVASPARRTRRRPAFRVAAD